MKTTRLALCMGLSYALLCGAPAMAQDEPSEPAKRQVLITKLFEAHKKQKWSDLISAFQELEGLPNAKISPRLLYMKAQAHHALKQPQPASDALETHVARLQARIQEQVDQL